mmetsp:Transcript_1889/g.4770  ORF Transcript_1889/g.4770 Transcript_1889/m.4770 type:complete len:244 (+) Transcript_1889:536-1267(+)
MPPPREPPMPPRPPPPRPPPAPRSSYEEDGAGAGAVKPTSDTTCPLRPEVPFLPLETFAPARSIRSFPMSSSSLTLRPFMSMSSALRASLASSFSASCCLRYSERVFWAASFLRSSSAFRAASSSSACSASEISFLGVIGACSSSLPQLPFPLPPFLSGRVPRPEASRRSFSRRGARAPSLGTTPAAALDLESSLVAWSFLAGPVLARLSFTGAAAPDAGAAVGSSSSSLRAAKGFFVMADIM